MVTGVNTGYNNYNQYPVPNSFGLNNSYVQSPNFMANQTQTQSVKTAADGKDDGHISMLSKLKNLGVGALKFVTGMFTDEDGSFSLGQTVKTAVIAAGIGAVCVLTAGTAVPAILMATGVAVSGVGVGKAAINAALADTDAEAEQAWQSLGSNGVALGLSVAGAKSVAKSSHAAEAAAGKFDGVTGTWNAVKTTFTDAAKPAINAFEGVKDAYQGATTLDKVINAGSKVKSNVTAQAEEFSTQVGNNFNKTIYGTSSKIESEANKLAEKKTRLEERRDAITDKNSTAYKTLDKKVKTVEAQQKAMSEINQMNSWEEANAYIDDGKDVLAQLKAKKQNNPNMPKEKLAEINDKIEIVENTLKTAEQTLARKTSEVRAIDARIKTLNDKLAKAETPEKIAKLEAQISELQAQRTAANFELPQAPATEVKFTDVAAKKAEALKAQGKFKIVENKPNTDYYEYLNAEADALTTQRECEAIAQAYKVQQAATPGGFKTHATKEILNASKDILTEGTIKNHIFRPERNTAQWLTVGIAGRQFGETPEVRFYNQLSPQEQQYFKSLPYAQKLALINTYVEVA